MTKIKQLQKKLRNGAGFTLIEILVVATIIALLASAASVAYSQFGKQARDARRKADLESVRAAVEMYRSNEDTYPVSITFGGDLCDPLGCSTATYIESIPNDPKNPTYKYYYSGTASDYTIGAYLETASTCAVTISCTGANCNYCLGPYGEK
ncbi:hypothetical protein A2970_02485 [Candidatus Roizmanbacteria bacterium RIFCSPLOWO2_01_FULL_44_13]|uniref:Type II secretion system protein GspG C-terminal domain-containing protein n=1 Tax=Candidatus Roizmanbacteria bacterium RIFCSPLOWO2_01_FULL_44_13 TaxID=1802069 RepID=A0A1F7JCP3_9BACT|nr:MAG: hypothetical protein A2970_02485 [Candidatus Roizmanbacteria bacterium RIFCSPLOWO2_01_FULL_44_13]